MERIELRSTDESELRAQFASRLLDLAAADELRSKIDQKLIAGGLEEDHRRQVEDEFTKADDEVDRLRTHAKSLLESLTGVRLDHIIGANL